MSGRRALATLAIAWLAVALAMVPVRASPWAEVGDAQLRSDIEILANAGVLDNLTTNWPLPWAGILARLDDGALAGQPDYVREAGERVLAKAQDALHLDKVALSASVDATNDPNVAYGFDGMGRETVQAQVSAEYVSNTAAIRINAGAIVDHKNGHTEFMPDGSYAAFTDYGVLAYAGYVTHWWGPGWISALSISNNARPFPQVGVERLDTAPLEIPVLSWLGPVQEEVFLGWLDDSRDATNTLLDGARVSFSPIHGLELALERTDELCGKGHPCKPLATYFDFRNDPKHPSRTNDEADIDIRYSNSIAGLPFSIYTQIMNEDTNPIVHSASSHLFGTTVWLPVGATRVRVTAEYTDSIATQNIFSFGKDIFGASYHDTKYADGMRYRGHTLGFSLDSDSRLATLQASWIGPRDIVYTLTYDHAFVGSPNSPTSNRVTTAPVTIDLGEARVSFPFRTWMIDVAGRLQTDQPRPDKGFEASIETALRVPF